MININEIEPRLKALLNSICTIHKRNYEKFVDILLRAYDRDLQGLQPLDRGFVEDLADLMATLRAVRTDTLHELKNFIDSYRNDYKYVYVVDCLGLPDLYALMCSIDNVKFNFRIFINQRTNTQAFKNAFASETMADVAKMLSGLVIRRLDTSLHEISEKMSSGGLNRNEVLNIIVGRMNYVSSLLASLMTHMRAKTMIVTDHGYDVIRIDSKYIINHVFTPNIKPILAKLALVVLLKK